MPAKTQEKKAIEFYTIQLSLLADGAVYAEMIATSADDQELGLLSQELIAARFVSIDEAIENIRVTAGSVS